MSEKTLRKVNEEAGYRYAHYKEQHTLVHKNIADWQEDVDAYAEQTCKEERKLAEAPIAAQGTRELEITAEVAEAWVGRIAYAAFSLEEAKEFAVAAEERAIGNNAAHYRTNQAAYQEAAIIEARLDGVEVSA